MHASGDVPARHSPHRHVAVVVINYAPQPSRRITRETGVEAGVPLVTRVRHYVPRGQTALTRAAYEA